MMRKGVLLVAALSATIGVAVGLGSDSGTSADAANSWQRRAMVETRQDDDWRYGFGGTRGSISDNADSARVTIRWTSPTTRATRITGDVKIGCESPRVLIDDRPFNRRVRHGETITLRNWSIADHDNCSVAIVYGTENGPNRAGRTVVRIDQRN